MQCVCFGWMRVCVQTCVGCFVAVQRLVITMSSIVGSDPLSDDDGDGHFWVLPKPKEPKLLEPMAKNQFSINDMPQSQHIDLIQIDEFES